MTQTDLNRFRMTLTAKHVEAARATGRRDAIAIERAPDALDETQFAAERELSTRNLERQSHLLRNIRAALNRIEEGSYGTCLECEEEISHKRLQAMPWAALCIACQEATDQNRQRNFVTPEGFLDKAA